MPARRRSAYGLAAAGMLILLSHAVPAAAGGLRCSLGEIVIENLEVGHAYSLRALANLPLSLTSTTDGPVRVGIEPQVPDSSELRRGAEAIPDKHWASALPDTLALDPGQTLASELSIAIPNDP